MPTSMLTLVATLIHLLLTASITLIVQDVGVVYPLPCLWEESDHPAFVPPAILYLHLASSSISSTESVHKARGDSVVRMWVQLKRWCVSGVWVLQRGNSGDGCDLALTVW